MRADAAILARGLRKSYRGGGWALDGVDLEVESGTVHGLLGPNGAGKTTTVRVLATLASFDAGRAWVAGVDVAARPGAVRERIGFVGQYAAVDEVLSGRRNLEMFGRLYHLGRGRARARAQELLERFDLVGAAERPVRTYSGGMRRRLDLAAGLVLDPRVLFLDEPTTGLDPRSRGEVWSAVRELVEGGTTVLLTTQYLEEADRLADRISVMDAGRVIAQGAPAELKARVGGGRVEVVVGRAEELGMAAQVVERMTDAPPSVDRDALRVCAPLAGGGAELTKVVRALGEAGLEVEDIALRRPTLDDVFLSLTGGHGGGSDEVAGRVRS
ncbi:ATP-binding cassette domain-containing protein [Nocardiopsis sp. MG754419]|uniref:ATP-binding cassette domain-containing protein n=1 Tax=Nocardiopsis sp. MG754419 TaxID=2259865 RepID=UPI0024B1B100|nr:ATP-binding cassette domain-containing protein [Nocardiopsis sp. MG754419]MBR8745389.1 daunorubicin/doxorubicin resistance ABC transporter ATP-binding protein DrrA [Nocardiopsis sp. MG754419]